MYNTTALALSLLLSALTSPASSALTPSPHPSQVGVTMPLSHIEVKIVDGVATTTLHQTLRNHGPRNAEAAWLLPLPEGAVVDGFTMTMDGVATTGKVLNAEQARTVYEGIVRQRKDPGLLRHVGRGCLQANIFPVPPNGDVEVTVTYRQVLPEIAGLTCWSLPSADAGLAGTAPEQIELELSIESTQANLANIFSPNRKLHVAQTGKKTALASLESAGVSADELQVFYALDQTDFALDMLSYKAPNEQDGTFILMVSPRQEWDDKELGKKEITFVVDISGSMAGEKIAQARGALSSFLSSLHPGDRFNVIPFSTTADKFFKKPVEANLANINEARDRIGSLVAAGGTNIAGAMEAALKTRGVRGTHIPITVFLTDGLPTVGIKGTEELLESVDKWNRNSTRIFVLGVGNDVNTILLDQMAADANGTRGYVRPDEDIEVIASDLFHKLSHPVMSGLALAIDGVRTTRLAPEVLPDLFVGERLSIVGRYEGEGSAQITLTGLVAGELRSFKATRELASRTDQRFSFVPSLWAERQIAVLLDVMRLEGKVPELYDEVVRLGSKYNIVTPYTSHLILEEGMNYPSTANTGGAAKPTSPGRSSPGSPAPAPATGAGDWYLGGGQNPVRLAEMTQGQLIKQLVQIGVLPADATDEELAELALAVAAELRASENSLRGLGSTHTGSRAVDDSAYLASLIQGVPWTPGGKSEQSKALLELFSRRIGDRVFHLRGGFWTEAGHDEAKWKGEVYEVEAYSSSYFDLVSKNPKIALYLALSDRMVILVEGAPIRIAPPAPGPKNEK